MSSIFEGSRRCCLTFGCAKITIQILSEHNDFKLMIKNILFAMCNKGAITFKDPQDQCYGKTILLYNIKNSSYEQTATSICNSLHNFRNDYAYYNNLYGLDENAPSNSIDYVLK